MSESGDNTGVDKGPDSGDTRPRKCSKCQRPCRGHTGPYGNDCQMPPIGEVFGEFQPTDEDVGTRWGIGSNNLEEIGQPRRSKDQPGVNIGWSEEV